MLLTAAGYGQNGEYVGASWSMNVIADAIENGIFTGTKATNYGAPATREEAALYVFNGLTNVDQVKYSKDTETYELTVKDGQSIGEQKYGLATEDDTQNGVDGYVWKSNGKAVSSFISSENVLYTSMDDTPFAYLTTKSSPLYTFSTNDEVTYVYNGAEVPTYATKTAYAKGSLVVNGNNVYTVETAIEVDNDKTFAELPDDTVKLYVNPETRGVIANFIDTDFDGLVDKISIIKKSVAVLKNDPTVTRNGKIRIPELGVPAGGAEAKNVPGYEDLAAGDVVLYYTTGNLYHIEVAEAVYGKITAKRTVSGDVQIVFDGDTYLESGLTDGTLFDGITSVDYNVDAVLYLDNNGYVVELDTDAVASKTAYAVLLDAKEIKATGWQAKRFEAQLLFMDGTIEIVSLAKVNDLEAKDMDQAKLNALARSFYTYAVDKSGAYVLTSVEAEKLDTQSKAIVPNKAQFIDGNVGNANTVFLLNGSMFNKPGTYVVYKGIANVPELSATTNTVILKPDGVAEYVFVQTGTLKAPEASKDLVYFVNVEEFTYYPGEHPYREYDAIVDGELTTVYVLDAIAEEVDNGLFNVELSSGIITDATAEDTHVGTGTKGAANGIITVTAADEEDAYYTYDSNTVVYFVDKDGNVTEATVAYIENSETDDYAIILVKDTDDLASVVIIREN
jgi:hypothetical protein